MPAHDHEWLWDVVCGLGCVILGVGLWWLYPPVCLIALGTGLLVLGLWGAKLWAS